MTREGGRIWQIVRLIEPEALFWTGALVFFASSTPQSGDHFSFCFFRLLGFDHCPGCGVGHALSYILHGNLTASLQAHWIGIPAFIIILCRIFTLIKRSIIRIVTYTAVPNNL